MTIQYRAYDLDLDYRDALPQTPPGMSDSLPATPVTPDRAVDQRPSQFDQVEPQTPSGMSDSLPATPVTPDRAVDQRPSQFDQVDSSPLTFRCSPDSDTSDASAMLQRAPSKLLRAMLHPSLDAIGRTHQSLVDRLAAPQSPPPAPHASASHAIEVKQAPRVRSLQAALEELAVWDASDASLPVDCDLAHNDASDASGWAPEIQGAAKRARTREAQPDLDVPEAKRLRRNTP